MLQRAASPEDVVRSLVRLLLTTHIFTPIIHEFYISTLYPRSQHTKSSFSVFHSSRLRIVVPSPPSGVLYKRTTACRLGGLRHK